LREVERLRLLELQRQQQEAIRQQVHSPLNFTQQCFVSTCALASFFYGYSKMFTQLQQEADARAARAAAERMQQQLQQAAQRNQQHQENMRRQRIEVCPVCGNPL